MNHKLGSIELRAADGTAIDDVVVEDADMFRMEHTRDNIWWLRVYTKSGKDLVITVVTVLPPTFEVEDPGGGLGSFKGVKE